MNLNKEWIVKQTKDYEALGGNDYVHKVILPEMNKLDVISMNNLQALKEMYDSRSAK